jgi:hypothetical protein
MHTCRCASFHILLRRTCAGLIPVEKVQPRFALALSSGAACSLGLACRDFSRGQSEALSNQRAQAAISVGVCTTRYRQNMGCYLGNERLHLSHEAVLPTPVRACALRLRHDNGLRACDAASAAVPGGSESSLLNQYLFALRAAEKRQIAYPDEPLWLRDEGGRSVDTALNADNAAMVFYGLSHGVATRRSQTRY